MGVSTQTSRATLKQPGSPTIYNKVTPGTANTEFSQAFTLNTKKIEIRSRTLARLQFSFVSGESGTKFITIPPGTTWTETGIDLSGVTIYLQSDKISHTVEILEWV